MTGSRNRVGVVLLQLGGPDSLESVEGFLFNLFCDPEIIDLPFAFLFRKPLAGFIARRRAVKVQEYYKRIGGKSPILKLTRRQAAALERELAPSMDARVHIAMRYWHPLTEEIVDALEREQIQRLVLLPLYPHFSKTTTGSSVNEWRRVTGRRAQGLPGPEVIHDYPDHPDYIRAIVQNIGIALNRVPAADRGKVHLVFSAHGTPVKLVRAGDPYKAQIERTYEAVVQSGSFGLPHTLCFQSKVGPERWLEPSLDQTLDRLAGEGITHVLVIPIAFVSDHSETLWEINIEARHRARELGIQYFDMSPALHTNKFFIQSLADLVRKAVSS